MIKTGNVVPQYYVRGVRWHRVAWRRKNSRGIDNVVMEILLLVCRSYRRRFFPRAIFTSYPLPRWFHTGLAAFIVLVREMRLVAFSLMTLAR